MKKIQSAAVLLSALFFASLSVQAAGRLDPVAPFARGTGEAIITADPEVRSDGIFYGSKGLMLTPRGNLHIIVEGRRMARLYFNINTPARSWMVQESNVFFNKNFDVDIEAGKFVFTANFPVTEEGAEGSYFHSAELLPDGNIRMEVGYDVPEDYKSEIRQQIFFISIPFSFAEGEICAIDDKLYSFAEAGEPRTERPKSLYEGRAEFFEFTPETVTSNFRISGLQARGINLRENRLISGRGDSNVGLRIFPRDGRISFNLDLSSVPVSAMERSKDFHAGVDFWASDRLHVPDYSKSRNLVQNPAFEAGLRYFRFHPVGGSGRPEYDNEDLYRIDPTVSKFGNHSLKIRAENRPSGWGRGQVVPTGLGTLAIPVEEGQKYTVSCYAKGDKQDGLSLRLSTVSDRWTVFPNLGTCRISDDWRRYDFSFVAPNNVISVFMTGFYSGGRLSDEGIIWVDGLQVEKGDLTPFTKKPVQARLATSDPDNFIEAGSRIDAALNIYTSKTGSAGQVKVNVEDFHYRQLYAGEFDFKTDGRGMADIKLPFEGRFPRGIFIVKASFEMEDGYADTEHFRFSIMDFLENTHKNKHITGTGLSYFRIPRRDSLLERARAIGLGAAGQSSTSSEEISKLDEYGIEQRVGNIARHRTPQAGGFQIRGDAERRHLIEPISEGLSPEKLTPEFLKKIEEASYKKASIFPKVEYWVFDGEPDQRHKYAGWSWEDIVKIHEAAARGVKRAGAKFLNGGPTNMMPRGGTRWVRSFLEAGGNRFCDGASIHPYRAVPEDPDLDDDAAEFFTMLDEVGMQDSPVFWMEGIYHTNYVLPAYGLDTHRGCSTDHYRAGAFSYHMGWGERISAAYYARSWLVGLKYADRVKVYNGWANKSLYMDAYLTPFALQKATNTLGRLLGNADFKEDIRFAPNIRCYVFEDEDRRPVAAIWSHLAQVDRGNQNSPVSVIPAGNSRLEFFDLMEAPISPARDDEGNIILPLPSFPVFVRGEPGTLRRFSGTLGQARLADREEAPLQISVKPYGTENLEVAVVNILSRPFRGEIAIGGEEAVRLSIPARGTEQVLIPLPEPLLFSDISEFDLPIAITDNNGEKYLTDASFRGFAVKHRGNRQIVIDGNLEDWRGVPEIRMKNRFVYPVRHEENREEVGYPGDHEASFMMLWDEENLYLAVNVIDDKFVRLPDPRGNFDWQNDTMQVYIDTLCDAREKTTRGFDENDYNYDFFPDPYNNMAVAYRRFAPEQQLTGGTNPLPPNTVEPGIKTAFRLTEKGYVYEIAFPQEFIMPMLLEEGYIAGFSIFLNDRDTEEIRSRDVVKSALTLTPPGTGGYMNPHLYPVMMLSGEESM